MTESAEIALLDSLGADARFSQAGSPASRSICDDALVLMTLRLRGY